MGFLDDHLLRVEHQAHTGIGADQQVVEHFQAAEQVFHRVEHRLVRDRDAGHRAQNGADDLGDLSLQGQDFLQPPASHLRERQEAQRFGGRGTVNDDDVVVATAMVLVDPQQAGQLLHPWEDGDLFRNHVVEAAPSEQ